MMIPAPDIGSIPGPAAVRARLPDLASAAQAVYDAWDQGDDGNDPELGAGGICDRIADALLPVLLDAGVEHVATVQASCGENHIFVVALLEDGIYHVDIPPGVYEDGGGYVWRKRPGIRFSEDDVALHKVAPPVSPEEFEAAYCEG